MALHFYTNIHSIDHAEKSSLHNYFEKDKILTLLLSPFSLFLYTFPPFLLSNDFAERFLEMFEAEFETRLLQFLRLDAQALQQRLRGLAQH